MIKMIAVDLDGTLLTDAKEISQRNVEVLKKAEAEGVKIVVCTGRPLMAIGTYLERLGLEKSGDYCITFNGGLVQKTDTGEILEKAALTTQDVLDLYELGKKLELPIDVLSDGDVFRLPSSAQHISIYNVLNLFLNHIESTIDDITDTRLYNKVVSAYDADFLDEQIPKIPEHFRERFEVIKTRSNLLEFMPKGVTKAFGIQQLIKHLGISKEEVMALGDEENDLPMIEYAGVGVAMANAVPMVKAAADYVTLTNEEDGVAKAVERFALGVLK